MSVFKEPTPALAKKSASTNLREPIDKENQQILAPSKTQNNLSFEEMRSFKNAIAFLPKTSASLLNRSLERVEENDQQDDL